MHSIVRVCKGFWTVFAHLCTVFNYSLLVWNKTSQDNFLCHIQFKWEKACNCSNKLIVLIVVVQVYKDNRKLHFDKQSLYGILQKQGNIYYAWTSYSCLNFNLHQTRSYLICPPYLRLQGSWNVWRHNSQ